MKLGEELDELDIKSQPWIKKKLHNLTTTTNVVTTIANAKFKMSQSIS